MYCLRWSVLLISTALIPPNPFFFIVNNGEKLSVLENEDALHIESSGPETPQDVIIYIGNETYYA